MSEDYTSVAAIITLTATIGALLAKLQAHKILSEDDVNNTISAAMAAAINGNPEHKTAIESSFAAIFPFAKIFKLQDPNSRLN